MPWIQVQGMCAPLIKVISTYEHEKVRRVLVPEWTARSKYRYIIG